MMTYTCSCDSSFPLRCLHNPWSEWSTEPFLPKDTVHGVASVFVVREWMVNKHKRVIKLAWTHIVIAIVISNEELTNQNRVFYLFMIQIWPLKDGQVKKAGTELAKVWRHVDIVFVWVSFPKLNGHGLRHSLVVEGEKSSYSDVGLLHWFKSSSQYLKWWEKH